MIYRFVCRSGYYMLAVILLLTFLPVIAGAVVIHDEATSGDLNIKDFGVLSPGTNTVIGALNHPGDTRDGFEFIASQPFTFDFDVLSFSGVPSIPIFAFDEGEIFNRPTMLYASGPKVDFFNQFLPAGQYRFGLGVNAGGTATYQVSISQVVVGDVTAPVPDVDPLPTVTGECSVTLTAPTATDDSAGTITGTTTDPLTYNTQGTFTVTWTYDDGNGNTSQQTQTVIVDDVIAPVPDVDPLPAVTGECSATVTTTPTATDNCVGSVIGTTTNPLTYNTEGTFTVTWTYDDGNGNSSTQTQDVVVDDVTAPVPDVAQLPTVTGECSATITETPTATDNCVGSVLGTTTDPVEYNTQGTFTVTWTYDDGNGNSSQQEQTVTVNDVTAPTVTITSPANGDTFFPADTIDVVYIVSDSCDANPSVTVTPSDPINPPLNPGSLVITVSATDASNNQGTASVSVTVLTVQQAIQQPIDDVNALVDAGILNPGQGNALISKLNTAIKKMNKGNTNAAINNLNAFINQVNAFVNAGTLSLAKGRALIGVVQTIIESINVTAAPLHVQSQSILIVHGAITGEPGQTFFAQRGAESELTVTVKNLSTGALLEPFSSSAANGRFSRWFDLTAHRVVEVGDILKIATQSPSPHVGVEPVRHLVTIDDLQRGLIQLPDLVFYEIPMETELLSNYPNPFNPETWIPYRLAEDANVTLTIYDMTGTVVRRIEVGHQPAAVYASKHKAIYWDGRNDVGERAASNIYFYHLQAGDFYATRKMTILK